MQALPASPLLSSTSSPPSLATVMAEQILPPPPPRGEIIIAIPIFKNFTALDAIGPYDSLKYLPNVKVFFVSHTKEPQLADSGTLQILPSHSFEDLPDPTIIIVPGGAGANTVALEDDEKGLHKEIIAWIQKAHKTTYMTTSVCTGALVLGAAGLLKGLNATTHHTAITLLREFGAIVDDIPERVIFQGKIATAAGVSSGIDFGVHLTRILADELTAKAVTFANEYAPEPPYDTGSIERADEDVQELSDKLYGDLLARPPQIPPFFR